MNNTAEQTGMVITNGIQRTKTGSNKNKQASNQQIQTNSIKIPNEKRTKMRRCMYKIYQVKPHVKSIIPDNRKT